MKRGTPMSNSEARKRDVSMSLSNGHGVGAWDNHDDPRDEWPTADNWNLTDLAGVLADAEDTFWTAYHDTCTKHGEVAGDTIGNQHEAMARRILTGPELADLLARVWQQGWEHHRQHPITDPKFAHNPYRGAK